MSKIKTIKLPDDVLNIETDINKIYDQCYNLSLDNNNKENIKNFMNNEMFKQYGLTKVFKEELEKSLSIPKGSKSIEVIINELHKNVDSTSFIINRILGLRNKFLNNNQKDNNKLKY